MDDCTEFSELFRGVVLDVCNSLKIQVSTTLRSISCRGWDPYGSELEDDTHFKVRNELLHDSLPSDKTFDEYIRWLEVVWCDVLLDERLVSRDG